MNKRDEHLFDGFDDDFFKGVENNIKRAFWTVVALYVLIIMAVLGVAAGIIYAMIAIFGG